MSNRPTFKDGRHNDAQSNFTKTLAHVIDKRDVFTGKLRNRYERRVMASTKKKAKGQ